MCDVVPRVMQSRRCSVEINRIARKAAQKSRGEGYGAATASYGSEKGCSWRRRRGRDLEISKVGKFRASFLVVSLITWVFHGLAGFLFVLCAHTGRCGSFGVSSAGAVCVCAWSRLLVKLKKQSVVEELPSEVEGFAISKGRSRRLSWSNVQVD